MDEGEELVKIGASSRGWRRCGLVNRGLYQCRCSGDGFLRLSHKEETVVRIHPPAQERDKDGRILGVSPGGCYGGHAARRRQIVQCHPRVNK